MLRDKSMQSAIDNCNRCHATCAETVQYSLEKSGKYVEANHVRRLQDCAEICLTCGDFMLRGSELHPDMCGVCAEACERCARSCEQVGGGMDAQLKECAETCRECAQSCLEMSRHGHKAA